MFTLALRNTLRNLRKMLPMMVILGVSFFILFTVNSILMYINTSFSSAYINYLSGDASIAPGEGSSFSIFGSEALLVGEYLVPPVIDNFDRLSQILSDREIDYTPIVTSLAQMNISGHTINNVLFGIDSYSYQDFFPDLELIEGDFFQPGEASVMIQEHAYNDLLSRTGADTLIGQELLLTVAYESTFTIREATISGVFKYPVEDSLLDNIALIDADTARSLNGYVYGAVSQAELSESEAQLLDTSLDDLFGSADPQETTEPETSTGIFDSIDSLFSVETDESDITEPVSNAWNFILAKTSDNQSSASLQRELRNISQTVSSSAPTESEEPADSSFTGDGYIVRNWRYTIGGTVLIVWFIQILFNIGIAFVLFGALAVAVNSIVLSVLERRKEIGTMRSIGAQRFTVARLISLEVLILILGAALVGIFFAVIFLIIMNSAEIMVANQYFTVLFGGGALKGAFNMQLFSVHLLVAIAVALVSIIYPLKKTMGLSPEKAMR